MACPNDKLNTTSLYRDWNPGLGSGDREFQFESLRFLTLSSTYWGYDCNSVDLIGVSHPLKRSPNHQATGRLGPAVMGAVSKPPKTPATTWGGRHWWAVGSMFQGKDKSLGQSIFPSFLQTCRWGGVFFCWPPQKKTDLNTRFTWGLVWLDVYGAFRMSVAVKCCHFVEFHAIKGCFDHTQKHWLTMKYWID